MDISAIFAANLREACRKCRTISEVCLGAGINRQQFNKYLAGTSLPNSLTLKRICDFLGILPHELFLQQADKPYGKKGPNNAGERSYEVQSMGDAHFGFLSDIPNNFDFNVNELPAGKYWCYSLFAQAPGMLVKSLVVIKRNSNVTKFSRLTVFKSTVQHRKSLAKAHHYGTVFASNSEVYFLGRNRYSPHQVSLMTIERGNNMNGSFFSGLILTRSGSSSFGSRTCLLFLGNDRVSRENILTLGLIHQSDQSVGPLVQASLFPS